MSLQYGLALRTAQVAAINSTIGSGATLKIYTGSMPSDCATAVAGGSVLLATISLPNPFLTSISGVASLTGTWSTTAVGSGTATFFRIYDSSNVCHMQGDVTTDLVMSSTAVTSGVLVSVGVFSITAANP